MLYRRGFLGFNICRLNEVKREYKMGIDACIDFKTKPNKTLPDEIKKALIALMTFTGRSNEFTTIEDADYNPDCLSLNSIHRYYGIGYERGDWPKLCLALTILLTSPEVEKVYYYGDNEDPVECTHTTLYTLSVHYGLYDNEPYRNKFR
jgi:hypothetical protein